MISKEHYFEIANKYGEFASWAIWAEEGIKPKSNIGDMDVFDLDKNPALLQILNPNVILVGLNFSRSIEKKPFTNFHDSRPHAQDYKLRFTLRNTVFYGGYMTDIIKDFEEKVSGNVKYYLKKNPDFEIANVELFRKEINDLKCIDPLIVAFGNIAYDILDKHLGKKHRIKKVGHYSQQIRKQNYRDMVLNSLLN